MRSWRTSILSLGFLGFFLLAGQPNANAQGWPNGYARRRVITIDHTKVSNSDQTNFPVLVSGAYPDMATTTNGGQVTNASGYDIILTSDANGANLLSFEQESYVASTGAIVYWVSLPTASHTTDTVFYLFYGNSSVTSNQSNKTAVWDSNYKGVWHLPNGSNFTADSTSNGNNGTNHSATAGSGIIGGGASVNSGSYIDVGSNLNVSGTTAFTVSAWLKPNGSFSGYYPLISGAKNQQAAIGFLSTTMRPYSTFHYSSYNFHDLDSGFTTTTGNWYYIVGTYDGSHEKIYINGVLQASLAATDSITSGDTDTSVIGMNIDNGAWLNATIDEVRFSNAARSADLVATEFNNQTSPSTFSIVGSAAQSPSSPEITRLVPDVANYGTTVSIEGTNFGTTQGTNTVSLNGSNLVIQAWTDTTILAVVPFGATSGNLNVTVGGQTLVSPSLVVTPLPPSWSDGDIGSVGSPGSASYTNGTFTVEGGGQGVVNGYTTDAFNFQYQPLSGDGSIVARVVSLPQGAQAGVMIRETLSQSSTHADTTAYSGHVYFNRRTSTGGTNSDDYNGGDSLPVWVKIVRSGNSFSSYWSPDSMSWYQIGTTQTITMAQSVYVGLAVAADGSSTSPATATFDSVSVSPASAPAPTITSTSATTGSVGNQVVINGSGFGAAENGSLVTINDLPATINSWSDSSIIVTIPSGATSGPLLVSLSPSMNDSNAVNFSVTSQPLPTPWMDQDVGLVGVPGGATYSNGVFSVSGAGGGVLGSYSADAFNFDYVGLPGDGSIVARVVSVPASSTFAGVMIRETLDQSSTHAYTTKNGGTDHFIYRTSTGGSNSNQGDEDHTIPIWLMLVRAGSSVTGYSSDDGVNWSQIYAAQTISMAQNVYVGLAVSSQNTSALATATFDNVSVTIGTSPFVTGVSPDLGPIGSSVTITGSNFCATQGTSTVSFNGTQATSITSWSSNQIVATVPAGTPAGAGPVTVTVNSISSPGTVSFTAIEPGLTSLTPPAAQVGGTVTLTGTGFGSSQGGSTVQFNGVQANVSSWSPTSITAIVPSGTTSGPVTVTEDGVTSNGVQFTLLEALTITGLSPSAAAAGSTVTITGTGFGATQSNSSAVFYISQPASITSWSDTQIVATVPSQAISGVVGVCVASQCGWGSTFTLTQSLQLTDSLGNQTTYISSMVGGQWVASSSEGSGCSSCSLRGTISNTYDSNGNVLSRTDENGHTTTYTYDANGNVLSVTAPISATVSATTSYTYNSFGEVLTTTDSLGNVTTNSYDGNGNLLSVTTPVPSAGVAASVTQFAYNSLGELTQITDPLSNQTKLTYTSAGLIYTITDAQNNVTTYGYDSHGNRTSVTDALTNQTTFTYDSMDRLTKITYPDTTTTQFGYDYRGRRTSVQDQNGKTTTYTYDDADRLTTVTDAANNVTTYGYDTENNLTSIEDANNHTTSFSYDAFGRVTQTTFPSGLYESYGYDGVGNLTSKTDRKSQYITYTYDQLNRLTGKTYPDSSTVNYTYDNDSRLTQVTDATGTYQFTFDNMGRLTGTTPCG